MDITKIIVPCPVCDRSARGYGERGVTYAPNVVGQPGAVKICPKCNGNGCNLCLGKGDVLETACEACGGIGEVSRTDYPQCVVNDFGEDTLAARYMMKAKSELSRGASHTTVQMLALMSIAESLLKGGD